MSFLHTESGYGQVIATEYGGTDQRELRSWTFDKVEDTENQYILVHQSPEGMGDSEYPVRNAPDDIEEQVENQEKVEIVERETPIWSAECTECSTKGSAEAEKGTETVEQNCMMCGKETKWKVNTW